MLYEVITIYFSIFDIIAYKSMVNILYNVFMFFPGLYYLTNLKSTHTYLLYALKELNRNYASLK